MKFLSSSREEKKKKMEIEKQIIRTYSRRQPITRYESRAVLVPSYTNPKQVRESRLNDKTLVVDNFDDTFDRLATGVVVPSPENSLDENGVAKKKDSGDFDLFKVPLQTKKNEKPKNKGKPKKKDLVSKAAGVKRKKVNDGSDDSGLSDQEETHKKQAVNSDNKKSKEKVKKVVKRKKNVSPTEVVTNDKLVVSESTDENTYNNTDNKTNKSTETDNFKKPKEPSNVNELKSAQYFQASTPRVGRIQSNMNMENISPVVMNIANERAKYPLDLEDDQAENAANDEHNASENYNKNTTVMNIANERTAFPLNLEEDQAENVADDQSNSKNATDAFVKPREITKVDMLKTSKNLLTSTPRVNKIRMPVNLQNLSPIISDKEKRATGKEKSSAVDADIENNQNGEVESNFNNDIHVPSEQLEEAVKSPEKVSGIEHSHDKGSEDPLSQERTNASQSDQQDLFASNVANENNNQDKSTSGNNASKSTIVDQDDSIVPAVDVESNTKQLLPENTRSYANSPLIFDDSEYIHIEKDKSNVVADIHKADDVEINFSQNFSKNIEQNNRASANSESTHVNPPTTKSPSFNVSTESSFYPHDWSNDYDSTYGYDQHKKNLERDAMIDSQLDEDKNKNSISGSEDANNTNAENVTEINEVSNLDNTEIQSVENHEQEKAEDTLCNEDDLSNNSNNVSNEQEEHHNAPSISNEEDNHALTNVKEDSLQDSQIAVEEKQHSRKDESTREDNHDSTVVEEDNFQKSQITIEEKQSLHEDESANGDNGDSVLVEESSFQKGQVMIEEKQSYDKDKSTSLINQQDESLPLSDNAASDGQSPTLTLRPSKRRKTDTGEIMIYNKQENDHANSQNGEEFGDENNENIAELAEAAEDIISKSVNTESTADTGTATPVKLPDKELQIVLSRINYEDYKSPILSQGKPVKRKSAKRVSRKSKDTKDESVSSKKKQDKVPKANSSRVTRRSVTEDKMKQLFVQYQCKNLTVYAVRLEDQKIDFSSSKSLKRKSRENSIAEDNELDNSLTNGGLTEFLSKLNDPMKVTMRRKTQRKYDGHLAAINEDQAGQNDSDDVSGKRIVTWGNDKRVTFNEIEENSEDAEDTDHVGQPIFLKPGKSWARSLSIINHFHNGKNLDELAAGRENWRHSVQTVLNMQPEVSSRSHSQNHEETRRESRASRASTQRESKSMRKSSIASNSRFSMRIIPSGKRSTLTDDLPDSQRISYISDRSRASRKTSLKIRRDTLIETEDDLIRSAKDIILKRCKQTSYEPFDVCFPDSYIDNCRKIGEGVYGEVFLYENGSEKSVIKIIPIEGDQLVNCEPQKKFHEILSEIIIAEELHKLRLDGEFQTNGFVEVNRIMCVNGKYPEKLIDLWYAYDEQKKSENDCPSMFEEDQLYIILELAHGGQDLEAYTFQNASESYAIFLQTALTLAVAEQSLEFEHRDLHWGNLLISKTEDKHSTYKLGSGEISLPTKGVKVAVIDFTLSRMSYQGCKIFNDLAADPTLFEAQGEYQFDIYRMMRDNVNDDWQQFNPFTNILWMDYTLEKMITAVRYKKKTTKVHKSAIEDMKALRKEIMNYSSAFDFVTNCKKVQALFDST